MFGASWNADRRHRFTAATRRCQPWLFRLLVVTCLVFTLLGAAVAQQVAAPWHNGWRLHATTGGGRVGRPSIPIRGRLTLPGFGR
jgi:hypothetical protein